MYHQYFNRKEYGELKERLINAINALDGKTIDGKPFPYGEQPNFDEKMNKLANAYNGYVNYCQSGHREECKIAENLINNLNNKRER